MSYKVIATPNFGKELKRLAKKYHSLKSEFSELISSLKENPEQGTPIGQECYKIRIAIASKGKGKSGGARVITCVKIIDTTVYLISIYDKSEQEDISDKKLKELIKSIL
ncbi:MAG: type II toxin-antitoxin system RelE/ParE family toxin [Flavobacteriales bacterium]